MGRGRVCCHRLGMYPGSNLLVGEIYESYETSLSLKKYTYTHYTYEYMYTYNEASHNFNLQNCCEN